MISTGIGATTVEAVVDIGKVHTMVEIVATVLMIVDMEAVAVLVVATEAIVGTCTTVGMMVVGPIAALLEGATKEVEDHEATKMTSSHRTMVAMTADIMAIQVKVSTTTEEVAEATAEITRGTTEDIDLSTN